MPFKTNDWHLNVILIKMNKKYLLKFLWSQSHKALTINTFKMKLCVYCFVITFMSNFERKIVAKVYFKS